MYIVLVSRLFQCIHMSDPMYTLNTFKVYNGIRLCITMYTLRLCIVYYGASLNIHPKNTLVISTFYFCVTGEVYIYQVQLYIGYLQCIHTNSVLYYNVHMDNAKCIRVC